jgi:dihydrofolate reductase
VPATTSGGRTQYYTAATLDGFVADPDHSLDWLLQFGESPTDDYPAFIGSVGALAMGSSTYQWILDHLVLPGADHPGPWPYTQPAWVFTTRTLPSVEGADISFVQGDVVPVHREMMEAAAGKNVWIVGGGDLAGQFHDSGLLDEMIVTIASVTLGAGKPLLPRAITTPPLQLLSAEAIGTSFAQLRYRVPRRGER